MQFFHPWFLAALATLAVPVIIHLFYFRRYKKVYFSSVRFLKEVKDETSARSKLKNLLVLVMRLLAMAFLVMAFAQPFVRTSGAEKYSKNLVGLFVDNSFSMNALSEDIPILSKAKQKARHIVEAYTGEDRFVILTHEFQGKQLRLVHQDEALAMIDEIQPTPHVHNLQEALERIQSLLRKETGNEHIYILSDFQRSITDLPRLTDTISKVHLLPLQSVQEANLAIDSAWFDSPVQLMGQASLLKFRIRNFGNQPVEDARVSLLQNNQPKPLGTIRIGPGESVTDTARIIINQPGWQEIQVEITDFPVQFDDKIYLTFNVNARIDITVISNDRVHPDLLTALQSLPSVNLRTQSLKNINYSTLSQNGLIILDGLDEISSGLSNELQGALRQGTNVLLFPGEAANLPSYNGFVQALGAGNYQSFEKNVYPVTSINTDEFTFREVYNRVSSNMRLPVVQGRYLKSQGGRLGEETIMGFADGKPFLSKLSTEGGTVFICSTPLSGEWNDLSRNPEIFIPMLFRMAVHKKQADQISRFIGRDEIIETSSTPLSAEEVIHLSKGPSGEDYIPYQRMAGNKVILDLKGSIQDAGIYQMTLRDTVVGKVAYNYNRKESDLRTHTLPELQKAYGSTYEIVENAAGTDFESWIKDKYQGRTFWRWFVAATLLFLLFESLLLRFWKT